MSLSTTPTLRSPSPTHPAQSSSPSSLHRVPSLSSHAAGLATKTGVVLGEALGHSMGEPSDATVVNIDSFNGVGDEYDEKEKDVLDKDGDGHGTMGEIQLDADGNKKEEENGSGSGDKQNDDVESGHLTGLKLILVVAGLLLSIFLISLDQTILSPALPVIASKFKALDNIGWIASAFFLTQAPLVLFYGQILAIARVKNTFMVAIALFEIGSLICAVSPNVNVLIFGRAFAGVGAGGLFVCVLTIISQIAPIEKRAPIMGAFGAVWGLSSVIGPLLGGKFTAINWRWCFWINLPIGAFTIFVVLLFLKSKPSPAEADPNDNRTLFQRWLGLDWIGGLLVLGITTCLILALSWGGNTKPWNSGAVIACFVVFGVVLPIFVGYAYWKGDQAILPLKKLNNRTLIGCVIACFMIMLAMLAIIYYLPLQYQAVKGVSATRSGIDILPFMLTVVGGGMVAGILTGITGDYWSFMVFGPLITSIGGGLMYSVTSTTSSAKLSGFQVMLGFGVGLALQQSQLAMQAEYHDQPLMIPQGSAALSFSQLIGGVIGIAIAQVLFNNELIKYLKPLNLSPETILALKESVETIKTLDGDTKAGALAAYVKALTSIYIMATPSAALSATASAFLVKRRNIKKMGINPGSGGA